MDVRCERCRAQYVFDEDQVTPSGLAVQCTKCGHLFRVKKKELVVTVPLRPEELASPPVQAGAARAPVTPAPATGGQRTALLAPPPPPSGFPPPAFAVPPPSSPQATPRPAAVPPPPKPSRAAAPPAAPRVPPKAAPSPSPHETVELREEELAAVKGRSRLPLVLGVVALAGVAVGAYRLAPIAGRKAAPAPELEAPKEHERQPEPVTVPMTVELPAARPSPEPSTGSGEASTRADEGATATSTATSTSTSTSTSTPTPTPTPTPTASPVRDEPVEPRAEATPKPRTATGVSAELAQADRLRGSGKAANLERALNIYGRIAARDPENVKAQVGRGLCYLDLEQYRPAEASFQAALALVPDDPEAIMGLAETYSGQGRTAEAIQYYEKYLALHPDGEEADVARNALEQLRR